MTSLHDRDLAGRIKNQTGLLLKSNNIRLFVANTVNKFSNSRYLNSKNILFFKPPLTSQLSTIILMYRFAN